MEDGLRGKVIVITGGRGWNWLSGLQGFLRGRCTRCGRSERNGHSGHNHRNAEARAQR